MYTHHVINIFACISIKILNFPCLGFFGNEEDLCFYIRQELSKGNIVVVAGFQGINDALDITTLGRGGSDTTAVALAAFLQADLCQIFTDVDGIYDRDPRLFPGAIRYGRIDYEKMLRLIANGAQVLHDRSVELAREYGICIEVLSSFTGAPGTIVRP